MRKLAFVIAILATLFLESRAMDYTTFHNITLPYDANIVNCIKQDSKGMIWLGTKRGLFSYNGYNAHLYIARTVQTIIQFDDHYLCIGTDDGICWLNLKTGNVEDRYPQLSRIKAVRSLLLCKGRLWIGTRDEGLFVMDTQSGKLVKSILAKQKETMVFELTETPNGIFVGSHEGLSFYDFAKEERMAVGITTIVYSMLYDEPAGCLWVGTEGNLYRYKIGNREVSAIAPLNGNTVKVIAKDQSGSLLLGTNNGLYVYSEDECKHIVHSTRNHQSLCNNVISDILCDKNSNLWFATDRGLSMIQMQLWYKSVPLSELSSSDEGNVFSCMLSDSRHEYWFGGENGLLHIQGDKVRWYNANSGLRHNHIRHIYEDRDGEIWIASDGSIARYDRGKDSFKYYYLTDWKGRNADWAYSIYEDTYDRLWIATYMGGLYVVDKKALLNSIGDYKQEKDLFVKNDDLVSTAYQIEADEDGNLWLNSGVGLIMVDVNTFAVSRKNVFLDNMVYADHAIWLSSLGQLSKYDISADRKIDLPFKQEHGMIHAFVHERNRVWFSTNDGLYYIDTKDNSIHASYSPESNYLTGFYDSERNEIVWGGEDNITHLYLHQASAPKPEGNVFITGVISGGEFVRGLNPMYNQAIHFTRGGYATFELSPLTYFPQNNEVFYYRLNREKVWHSMGKGQNQLTFAEMPYGRSQLSLSNTNPMTDKDALVSVYQVIVPYPFYLRWWAILVYIIVGILLVGAILKYIQLRNKRKFEEREREKSLELSKQKMDFFVNVSHELKTPLSLIIAPLSQMISETTNPKQRDSLKAIHKNSLRLNDLIYKILDFKRMEYESEDTLIRSHVELCSLIRNCIQTFATETEHRHIKIEFNTDKESLWLNADMLKLESVFINLISNAVKYVPDGDGIIEITLTSEGELVHITFADNGRGMPEEDIPMMFIKFFQGRNARRGGTGIGLYLVRKFIELHGGTVDVHNSGGLSVKVSLPIRGENAINYQNKDEITEVADKKEATLLIIDDNREIVDFLAESLSKTYTCMKAYNGIEGQRAIAATLPDLIIVDQMMPEMDGFEFCKWVRKNHPTANLPLMMLTAKDDTDTELESIKIGVDVFISKPFDIKKVQLHIAQLLQRRRNLEKTINIEHITNPEFVADDRRSADEILMGNITKTIEDNMEQESFNVSQLAQLLNIDQKQLYRKIKQLTGMTPIAYLKKLRMKKAAMLLKESRFTISEVMFLVGYTNASYFTKCFSEEFGLSPKQFIANELNKK